jgi:hypothetical protein
VAACPYCVHVYIHRRGLTNIRDKGDRVGGVYLLGKDWRRGKCNNTVLPRISLEEGSTKREFN